MKDTLTRLVLAIAVIAALTWIQCRINTKRRNRSKQTLVPFLAVLYCIAATGVLLRFYKQIIGIIDFLGRFGIEYIVCIVPVLNVAAFIAYIIYKIIGCVVSSFVFRNIRFPWITDYFYDYDEQYDLWFLKEKWVNLRAVFKWLTRVGAAATGAMLFGIWELGTDSVLYSYVFPVYAVILLSEIYCFLNGYTRKEYQTEVLGDDSISTKISNYYKIREIYERMFPNEILNAGTACDATKTQAPTNLIEDLENSHDPIEKMVGEFFKRHETKEHYDTDSILVTLKLMKGENVIFMNPFYRDLSRYVALPFINTLLSGKKCLVLIGRASTADDIQAWLEDMFYEYGRIRSMWRVKRLSYMDPECEVGLMTFSQLYDLRALEVNEPFIRDVDFVFMAEPSLIINTGQIAMSIIASRMKRLNSQPVYCISDRMVGGLVDTMSHLLQQEFTEVVAPPVSRNIHTGIGWKADGNYLRQKLFGKQTQYLGNGIELASVAIRNQIPEVSWYGETKVPVRDIKWIVGQHYPEVCGYMNLPIQQQSIYDRIKFISNIWSVPDKEEQFLIAEDEFVNVFNTMRTFLSRGRLQTFVNVLSEDYLMRDYMRYNTRMFETNPNAIPSLVPDYAKTERNTLIKLLLNMAFRPVRDDEILRELGLAGVDGVLPDEVRNGKSNPADGCDGTNGASERLYADNTVETFKQRNALQELNILLEKYLGVRDIFEIRTVRETVDGAEIKINHEYRITPNKFEKYFGKMLKTAFYICEDERQNAEYLDAKLSGHVTQTILPGQFVTYEGKYYQVKYISERTGVVLRRASKQYDGRKYYRQLREYRLTTEGTPEIVSARTVMDVEIVTELHNIEVKTGGYLEMRSNSDLRSARKIDLLKDPSVSNYSREYRTKPVIRIRLPESSVNIRFTFCLLLQELFRSVFPNSWQYLAVVSQKPQDVEGMLNCMTYNLEGNYDPDCIYLIEDSVVDLGLLDTVGKNMLNFVEILTDFLYWHFEKMQEHVNEEATPSDKEVAVPDTDEEEAITGNGLIARIKRKLKARKAKRQQKKEIKKQKKQGRKEKKKAIKEQKRKAKEAEKRRKEMERRKKKGLPVDDLLAQEAQSGAEQSGNTVNEQNAADTATNNEGLESKAQSSLGTDGLNVPFEKQESADVRTVAAAGKFDSEVFAQTDSDIFESADVDDNDTFLNDVFRSNSIEDETLTDYQRHCFLKFGFDEIDRRIRLDDVKHYLTLRGFSDNALYRARKAEDTHISMLDLDAVNQCDFCGMPITGVSYERLNDGRIRCNDCSTSAIRTLEEFKKVFAQSSRMMESFFGIEFKAPILVQTMDARKIARGRGAVFTPSSTFDARVVGYAQMKNNCYYLNVENGSPRLATIDTIVHEMTHIWQYLNWDDAKINELYPQPAQRDIIYEGMAVWTSIQYLYLIGENSYAQQQEELQAAREDVYGIGFRLFREKYQLVRDSSLVKYSPFKQFPPI